MIKSILTGDKDFKKRPLFFYGAGAACLKLLEVCDFLGFSPNYIVDRNPELWGRHIFGIRIISPSELQQFSQDCPVLISTFHLQSAEATLNECGFLNLWWFPRHTYSANLGLSIDKAEQILAENRDAMSYVVENLADSRSREVFNEILKLRHENSADFESIFEMNEYFHTDIVKLDDKEVFVDCGGFDGATTLEFIKNTGRKFEHAYIFEPIPDMIASINKNIEFLPERERITALNMAISDSPKKVNFVIRGQGSQIKSGGDVSVWAESIDSFFKEKAPPTFIKLDVEGAEMLALKGADGVIASFRPKLAVSIYHRFEDLWEIPAYIMRKYPFYRCFIRQHGFEAVSTVCYAIPDS